MASLEENVHIIPLGHEYDRAVTPFKNRSVDRVYLLSITERTGTYADIMVSRQEHFNKKVIEFFENKNIEVKYIEVQLFNILEVMKHISKIIKDEQKKGNKVHINISACGRKTSIGAAFAGMANKADVYYVSAETYSLTDDDFQKHGLSICYKGTTEKFENFELDLPKEVPQKILEKLYQENRGVRSTEIRDYLHEIGVEGFEIKLADIPKATKVITKPDGTLKNKHDEIIAQSIRLEKKYLGPLERSRYIRREPSGKTNILFITESGKYVACIRGQVRFS